MLFTEIEFEQLVMVAVNTLPPFFLEKMENVDIIVEAWPAITTLKQMKIAPGSTLLGLYEGIPLTKRTSSYHLVAPDVITIFQGPIEQVSGHNPAKIQAQVQHTVIHEIAHHFGISDERLIELGAY
jgi:predicted Zn-dependent protease with MMP-like domain